MLIMTLSSENPAVILMLQRLVNMIYLKNHMAKKKTTTPHNSSQLILVTSTYYLNQTKTLSSCHYLGTLQVLAFQHSGRPRQHQVAPRCYGGLVAQCNRGHLQVSIAPAGTMKRSVKSRPLHIWKHLYYRNTTDFLMKRRSTKPYKAYY